MSPWIRAFISPFSPVAIAVKGQLDLQPMLLFLSSWTGTLEIWHSPLHPFEKKICTWKNTCIFFKFQLLFHFHRFSLRWDQTDDFPRKLKRDSCCYTKRTLAIRFRDRYFYWLNILPIKLLHELKCLHVHFYN